MNIPYWLPWTLLAAACLHITEEFVWPGGFPAWYRRYRASARVTPKFLIVVNALLLIVCIDIGTLGRTAAGLIYWLGIAALLCSNAIWHVWAAVRSRAYSPGMVTGVLIYVPLTLFGYFDLIRSGAVSIRIALPAAILGGSYQFWDALFFRSKARTDSSQHS